MFKIQIARKKKIEDGIPYIPSRIVMGDFEEYIWTPVSYWTARDYRKQWKNALQHILKNETSCLVTKMYDPRSLFADVWPMLRKGDIIFVRNSLCFGDFFKEMFKDSEVTPDNAHEFVRAGDFEDEPDEDGVIQKVSEWKVPVARVKCAMKWVNEDLNLDSCCDNPRCCFKY